MKNQAITLGKIGILLPVAVIIPFIGSLAGLASLVLLLISFNYFSKVYENPAIFNKMLIGTIISIAGCIIGSIIIGISVGLAAFSLSASGTDDMGIQQIINLIFGSGFTILGFIIMVAGFIIGYYFVFKALKILAEKTGVGLFKTAGLLYFIGALTSVIFIGFLLMLIGWIINIIAFFTVKAEN